MRLQIEGGLYIPSSIDKSKSIARLIIVEMQILNSKTKVLKLEGRKNN